MRVAPGAEFETMVGGFATGLTGTIGVRVRDGAGGNAIARTTSTIVEDIAGSGIYRRALTAPEIAGEYWIIWDNGSGLFSDPELLIVSSSLTEPAVPAGRDLCALADVLRYVPGYVSADDTDATLQELITSLSIDAYQDTGREFTPRAPNPDTRVFEVDWYTLEERELEIGDLAQIDDDFELTLSDPDGTVLQTLQEGAYVALPRSRDAWEPITTLKLPRVAVAPAEPALLAIRRLITITGTYGFPAIPENVRQAIAKLVIVRYLTDVADHGTAFTDELDNINIAGLFRSATESLDRWRLPMIG
jgi:hypothetical protein